MNNYIVKTNKHWIYYQSGDICNDIKGIEGGKYLFFSSDQEELLKILEEEITVGCFTVGKVSKHNIGDYVLCLYYPDNVLYLTLAQKYKENELVNFQGWKSNLDTRKEYLAKKEKKFSELVKSIPYPKPVISDEMKKLSEKYGMDHKYPTIKPERIFVYLAGIRNGKDRRDFVILCFTSTLVQVVWFANQTSLTMHIDDCKRSSLVKALKLNLPALWEGTGMKGKLVETAKIVAFKNYKEL